ncbi:MAG TPA: glycosyltransferase family 4 protein [Fibrobacteria bacterium]|nr:glycosyltransferase family 4 protein [Fibrobacteria bacterium]
MLAGVKLFGSVDTFFESSGTLRLGRLVANATFLEALLRYGTFDQYEFFCPSEVERARLAEFVRALPDGQALLARCLPRHQLELPERMRVAPWEVMHFGGWSRYLPALSWLRARLSPRNFPLTGTIHSLDAPGMAGSVERLLGSAVGGSDAVFCTSRDGREAFRKQLDLVAGRKGLAWNGRLELVPLGVEDRCFHPTERSQARARLGIPTAARVALWIGRLSATSKADLHPLLYQWRTLSAQDGNRLLVLAGGAAEGDVRSLLQTATDLGISRSVRILPDIDDGTKLDLLGASDVFVSPVDNHQETFGISVVEAMAAGLPVVASDWDGYKDLVEHGVTGLRVPTRWVPPSPDALLLREILEPRVAQLVSAQGVAVDPGALREALADLLSEPDRAGEMGRAGRERARRLFSWPVVIARCNEVWTTLARMAQDAPVPNSGRIDPAILDPTDVFVHYGTSPPESGRGTLRLAPLGREILEGKAPMPATFTDLLAQSDGKLLTALVLGLRTASRLASAHQMECAVRTGRDPSEAAWLLSWLVKYGVIEVDPEKT